MGQGGWLHLRLILSLNSRLKGLLGPVSRVKQREEREHHAGVAMGRDAQRGREAFVAA